MSTRLWFSPRALRLIALTVCYSLIVTAAFLPVEFAANGAAATRGSSLDSKPIVVPNLNQQPVGRREAELLIRFRTGASTQNKDTILATHGTRRKRQLRGESTVEKLEVLGGQNADTVALQLRLNPDVEFAEPNFLINKDQVQTSDPRFAEQWALRNTGQGAGQFGSDINVTTAWQTTSGMAPTTIAVIDSGIDLTHPDLTNNRWTNPAPGPNGDVNGWDYITDTGVIRDEQGHGTAIAGIIAAQGNNAIGISGVMWRASLMSLRVLDNTGTGDIGNAIEAIDYAVQHGAEVINLSWGTAGYSLALKDAIERAMRRGVVVVCSAGNNGQDVDAVPYYPASYGLRDLIVVASTDNFDQLTTWSDYGPGNVTIAAPGTNILTTQMGGGYWSVSGTSVSAPLVSGVAGLVKSVSPNLSTRNAVKAIERGARKVASLSNKVSSGGVVDANSALRALRGNPYEDNGGGNQGGGNGGNNGQGYVPPGLRPDSDGTRGNGRDGRRETPPPRTTGAPGPNLPNLDQLRGSHPAAPHASQPIQANFACADCDPLSGGGGSQYYPAGDPNFSTARTQAQNEIGEPGVDLGSRNFNWGQSLLNLRGRAGLGLKLTLFYNSLVWTKDGTFIKYNADLGTPAPGFRLGLPTLQQKFSDSDAGTISYLMVTPSGGRIEMRTAGVGVFESADGSYTELKENTTLYGIVARHSGMSAAVASASTANGAQVVQWPDPGNNTNFQWQLVPTDSGYYKLVNQSSGKVATVTSASTANGANVVQWDWSGAAHQQWQAVSLGNGYFKLVARHSGKVLQVAGGSGSQGANLQQGADTGANNQQWLFAPVSTDVTVRTVDGMQFTFTRVAVNNEYRCTQVKDSNGNFISATYDLNNGHLQTITDTLGRVITFVYYPDGNLQAIRQTWAGGAHDWATFNYGGVTVNPQFGGGLLVNGPNNNLVTVLTRVNLHDGSSYRFDYNAAFGQVKRINHYAADDTLLSYTSYNVDSAAGQTDCPRFTERRDWIQLANGHWGGPPQASQEMVTTYAVAGDSSWSSQTLDDGTIYKEFFATSGWQKGLTTSTELWSAGVKQKWTTNTWTQDDVNLGYTQNPRPSETNIYDSAGNRRRTRLDYVTFALPSGASCSLPSDTYEYQADNETVYRRAHTDYNLDPSYVNPRILGLVTARYLYDGSNNILSKTTYCYDCDQSLISNTSAAPVRHDTAYDTTDLNKKRGNLMVEARWDAGDPDNVNKRLYRLWAYDTAGNLIATVDPNAHQQTISYADSFSDNVNRNTFAYPTQSNDAEGNATSIKYSYDLSTATTVTTPAPNTGQPAPSVTYTYDDAIRLTKVKNELNGAYQRWSYETNSRDVYSYSTIQNGAGELFSMAGGDGAGRAWANIDELPNSTATRYRVQLQVFDKMGRLMAQSNPAETDANLIPVAEDAGGWQWTHQTYDFKNRPLITNNPDGTTKVLSYGGCGCAGGEVTTVQDEHGRQRRLTKDNLGRLAQVEEMMWNTGVVYASTSYVYNRRDQILESNQAGQVRSFAYDGYARLQTRTTPEQGALSYAYNADDTPAYVTDARGAKTVFTYNPRHLITNLSYDLSSVVAGQNVAATANISYTYDPAGNRKTMIDGSGGVTYAYDNLSRLTSETRNFTAIGQQSFQLNYSFNLAGELTSITNPWGAQVSYGYDKAGRVTNVGGSGFAGVSNYASALTYRAFGATRSMSFGDGKTLTTAYDNRLRATKWDVSNTLGYNYSYDHFNEHTGRVTYAGSIYDNTLDRSYLYDQVGRLAVSHSGAEARAHVGSGQWGTLDGPYSQGYDFDVWGNITHKYGWGGEVQGGTAGQSSDLYYTYAGNKRNGFNYDASGNITNDLGQTFTYDATGQQTTAAYGSYSLTQSYDGDGLRVKKNDNGTVTYYLRSSVLGGQVVAELNSAGSWARGHVYLGSQLLAVQQESNVYWTHEDPITKSKRVTNSAGTVVSTVELDPWGADTNRSSNTAFQPKKFTSYDRDANGSDEAMFRRYNRWQSRFDQPDPYDGSYSLADPQSFNRYAYVQGDPVNLVDPSGLMPIICDHFSGDPSGWACVQFTDIPRWDGFEPKQGAGGPQDPVTQGIDQARQALQENALCRSLFGGTDPLTLLNTYSSNGLITSGSSFPVAQNGGPIRKERFSSGDEGARTSFAAGSYPSPTVPGLRVSASPITINQNGFYFSGRDSNGASVNTLREKGFEGLSLLQIRGAVIIHELLHVAGRIPGDLTAPSQSQKNSELVRRLCFPNTPVSMPTVTPILTLP